MQKGNLRISRTSQVRKLKPGRDQVSCPRPYGEAGRQTEAWPLGAEPSHCRLRRWLTSPTPVCWDGRCSLEVGPQGRISFPFWHIKCWLTLTPWNQHMASSNYCGPALAQGQNQAECTENCHPTWSSWTEAGKQSSAPLAVQTIVSAPILVTSKWISLGSRAKTKVLEGQEQRPLPLPKTKGLEGPGAAMTATFPTETFS